MVEILQTVLEALRVTQFASHYSNPLDQFLYAIFFPMILIVIILYLLMGRIFSGHRGLELLLGVSFFIFIIVYPPNAQTSLYGALAPIGAIWYVLVIVVGFFWILLSRMHPRADGGARGLSTAAGSELYKTLRGKEMPTLGSLTEVRRQLKVVEAQIAALEARKKDPGMTDGEKEKVEAEISSLTKEKAKLKDLAKLS